MSDMIVNKNVEELAENKPQMGNTFGIFGHQINLNTESNLKDEIYKQQYDRVGVVTNVKNLSSLSLCSINYHQLDIPNIKTINFNTKPNSNKSNCAYPMEKHTDWIELYQCIRYIYKNATSSNPCVDGNEAISEQKAKLIKDLIHRLWEDDWQQLLIRLEVSMRDFVVEARDHLRELQNVKDLPVRYLQGLLTTYGAFCIAAENLAPFLQQLDKLLMKRFSVNFELLNKYLFQTCLYSDSFVQNNIPLYISQTQSTNQDLIHSYLLFDEEMTEIASKWLDVKKLILKYSKKRTLSDKKGVILLEDWEAYREHREIASNIMWYTRDNFLFKNNGDEFDVQLLSLIDDITSRIPELKIESNIKNNSICKNYSINIPCSCDDCTIKHVLTCGLETPPTSPGDKLTATNSPDRSQLLHHLTLASKLVTDKVITSTLQMDTRGTKCKSTCQDIPNGTKVKSLIVNCKNNPVSSPTAAKKVPSHKTNNRSITIQKEHESNKRNTKLDSSNSSRSQSETKSKTVSCEKSTNKQSNSIPSSIETLNCDLKEQDVIDTDKKTNACVAHPCTVLNCEHKKKGMCKKQLTIPKLCCVKDDKCTCWTHLKKKDPPCVPEIPENIKQKTVAPTTTTNKDAKGHCCNKNLPPFCINQNNTDSNKNNKSLHHCNCARAEAFEPFKAHVNNKLHKMRNRLRNRLNEKRSNALKENNTPVQPKEKPVEKVEKQKTKGLKVQVIESNKPKIIEDTRDIKDLLNFIEGTDKNTKPLTTQKKGTRKKKQAKKIKEEKIKEEKPCIPIKVIEEKIVQKKHETTSNKQLKSKKEVVKLKEQNTKLKKNTVSNISTNNIIPCSKKKSTLPVEKPESPKPPPEKTGPMVTIKRVMEGSNREPTVTITLKGSTPDKDKLLYTLINGQSESSKSNDDKTEAIQKCDKSKKSKRKTKKENNIKREIIKQSLPECTIETKKEVEIKKLNKPQTNNKSDSKTVTNNTTNKDTSVTVALRSKTEAMLNLQMLRLPPGITITKVEGPTVNKKLNFNENTNNATTHPPNPTVLQSTDNRSGIIVVDTVKLKQDLTEADKNVTTRSKKKKKKKHKKIDVVENSNSKQSPEKPFTSKPPINFTNLKANQSTNTNNNILTLKNPMFYQLQETVEQEKLLNEAKALKAQSIPQPLPDNNQQASIIKGANGMVTIRSPRLGTVNGSCNTRTIPFMSLHTVGTPVLSDLKPVVGASTTSFSPPVTTEPKKKFNAQEILSGLPGIEITKINKNTIRNKSECKKVFQPADVSIIPTNVTNGSNGDIYKLFYDNSDWSLESVFAPKDIKEDEVLDADELELEAFKRFCQQSIPPERKEKVAYLNVKDIVLKKKTSSNVS